MGGEIKEKLLIFKEGEESSLDLTILDE